MGSHPTLRGQPPQRQLDARCPAKDLAAGQRQELAVHALAGTQPVSRLARQHAVSRRFVYQQAAKAEQALNGAFFPRGRQ